MNAMKKSTQLEKLERSPEDEEIATGEDNADADRELEDAKFAATKAAGFKPLTEAQKKRPDATAKAVIP